MMTMRCRTPAPPSNSARAAGERISTRLPACTATPAGDPCEVRIRASRSRSRLHLRRSRLDGGLDRFDGYVAARLGVGAGHDVARPESLREDGGGALGLTLEYALGADKSERQN